MTRDRLIELIQASVNGCARYWAQVIADYLIANGVTVGDANNATTTWRPVSEPPKEEGSYLVYSCKSKTVFTARYRPRCERWANRANGHFITNWMPLPSAPKVKLGYERKVSE